MHSITLWPHCSTTIYIRTSKFSANWRTTATYVCIGMVCAYAQHARTIEIRPSQQVQSALSSTDSAYVTATFSLAGISGTLATVTVALAVW